MKKKIVFILLFVITKVGAQTSTFATIDSLSKNGRYKMALQLLSEIHPPSFLSNYKMAKIYESIDDYKKGAHFYEEALKLEENNLVKIQLAKSYQKLKLTKKAILLYEEIVAKDSANLLLRYQLAKMYITTRKAKKSINAFKKLIREDSLNANYSYQLGIAFALKPDRDSMINSFIDAFVKDSIHIKAIYQLANSFDKLNIQDSTNLFIKKGLELAPDHINLNKLKVNQFYKEKNYVEAISTLKLLDSLQPNELYTKNMLGKSYYNIGEYDLAKENFEIAKKIDAQNFKTYTYLGHIEAKKENYKSAISNYMLATFVGIEKRDEEYYGLGFVALQLGNQKQALKYFERANKENKFNYNVVYQLATLNDSLYKDKKIAYNYYQNYISNFENKNPAFTQFVEMRIKEIKKDYFLRGEKLE